MGEPRFRVRFGDRPATEQQLLLVEDIVVEQEIDTIWEARIRLAMCLDDQGHWRHGGDQFAEAFARLRVELDAGDGEFVPLIDGPVARFDTALDSQPGRSSATLVVRDDSVFMHRTEAVEVFENRVDSDVADEVFRRFEQIADTRIERSSGTSPATVRRGTAIQFLRELARANECHAYVLPGPSPGRSIGCFLPLPEDPADLPPLVLIGDGRNLVDAEITEDPEGPETTTGRTLRFSDHGIASSESRPSEFSLMQDLPAVPDDLTALRLLPPEDNDADDPEPRTRSRSRSRSFAYRLTGRVVPGCYSTVLSPYRKVAVRAAATPYSGEYLLRKVTHHITPSLYTQEFEAMSDSRSEVDAAGTAESSGGLSVSFSASVSIF